MNLPNPETYVSMSVMLSQLLCFKSSQVARHGKGQGLEADRMASHNSQNHPCNACQSSQ